MAEGVHSTLERLSGGDDGLEPGARSANGSAPSAILGQTHWVTVGRLTPGLIHEINNILCVVGNHVQLLLLKNGGDNADIVKSLQVINGYTDRAQALLHRFAKYARPPGRPSSRFRVTDLLEDTLAFAHLQRPFRKLHLRKEFATDLPEIEGDPNPVMVVLIELVTIAAQAIPSGGTLTISSQLNCGMRNDPIENPHSEIRHPYSSMPWVVIGFTGVGQWPHVSDRELTVARALVEQLGGRLTCEDGQDATCRVSTTGIWLALPQQARLSTASYSTAEENGKSTESSPGQQ